MLIRRNESRDGNIAFVRTARLIVGPAMGGAAAVQNGTFQRANVPVSRAAKGLILDGDPGL